MSTNKLQVVCVDDEYLALQLLEQYIDQVPDLELVGRFKSPLEALSFLQEHAVDLLFLDVQMPALSGNNLLKVLPNPPVTVFTTAYAEYAPEAFDLNATDYLLKPFTFERFLQAVTKAREQLMSRGAAPTANVGAASAAEFMVIKVDGRTQKVYLQDILFIEGLKEYVRIHTPSERFVTLERMQTLEEELPHPQFLRVHKSYIVARDHVQSMEGNLLRISGQQVPVSRSRREEIFELIFGPRKK